MEDERGGAIEREGREGGERGREREEGGRKERSDREGGEGGREERERQRERGKGGKRIRKLYRNGIDRNAVQLKRSKQN